MSLAIAPQPTANRTVINYLRNNAVYLESPDMDGNGPLSFLFVKQAPAAHGEVPEDLLIGDALTEFQRGITENHGAVCYYIDPSKREAFEQLYKPYCNSVIAPNQKQALNFSLRDVSLHLNEILMGSKKNMPFDVQPGSLAR